MRILARTAVAFSVLVFSVFVAVGERGAYGATFTVNSTADGVDAVPGDGLCQSSAGICTLRAAIMEANALPGPDVIFLPPSTSGPYALSIPPTTPPGTEENQAAVGDLDITDHLTIVQFPATISHSVVDGGGLDRVFHVHRRTTVAIIGVTIQEGAIEQGRSGGGVLNEGTLTMANSSVQSNTSASFGGGIANQGTLVLIDTPVIVNVAVFTGGGITNSGTLVVTNSTVRGNSANSHGTATGGGISNHSGTLQLIASTVHGNHAGRLDGSSETALGAGIYNNNGVAVLTNSTVSDNSASGRAPRGDGIFNDGTVFLTNSTVSSNSDEGIRTTAAGTTVAVNTIIANHLGHDCFGIVTSLGHNLDSDNTCSLTGPNDVPGVNPLLGVLMDNGGPTLTHALLNGSPAINAGDNAACPATDQRGVFRGPDCDIGAYELVRSKAR